MDQRSLDPGPVEAGDQPARSHHQEADRNQHRRQPHAERDDQQEPEPDLQAGHGAQEHHGHDHGDGHHHHHLPEGPVSLRALVALGISGGIVPCPAALVVHGHQHAHGAATHRHAHLHFGSTEGEHVHLVRLGGRPFLVGLLHGLAGSAALMLLVLGTIPSSCGALAYILVFGLGSTAGMLLLSGLVGLPFARAAQRAEGLRTVLQVGAGVASAALGVWMLAGPAGA